MSIEFRTPVTIVKAIQPHPNADRLDIATVFDFNVVVRRSQYQVGDTVLYIPIDSILPPELEAKIFGQESKIKLTNGRVKQIRIRQLASQGMLVDLKDIKELHPKLGQLEEGQNLADKLNIVKYEPPAPDFQSNGPKTKKERNKFWENPYLHEYGGLVNAKWYPDAFLEGQEVVYQEKIHGTNARAAQLPFVPKTLFQKLKKFLGLTPKYQFCYGSNCVQLQSKSYTGFYDDNVYSEACKHYDIENKLERNETVYFEIYGSKIQKDYMYDCKSGERKIVVFDVKILAADKQSTRWLNTDELRDWCIDRNLPMVPELYRGPHSKDLAKEYTKGNSALSNTQKIREGIVIRDPKETVSLFGKKCLKLLSEEYLDKNNSDFH